MNPPIFVNVSTAPGVPDHTHREVIRYDDFVRKLMKMGTPEFNGLHLGIGVASEVFELHEPLDAWFFKGEEISTHLIEEFGDVEFYMQAAQNHYALNDVDYAILPAQEPYNFKSVDELLCFLFKAAGDFVDVIKKEYIYGKPREIKKVILALMHLRLTLDNLYERMDTNRAHVLQCNALKLETRYAGLMYSDQAAIARADKSAGE